MTVDMHNPPGTHGSPHKAPCRWSLIEDPLCPSSAWWFSACCLSLPLVLAAPHGYLWFLRLAAYPYPLAAYQVLGMCTSRGSAGGRTVSYSLRSAPTVSGLYPVCPRSVTCVSYAHLGELRRLWVYSWKCFTVT